MIDRNLARALLHYLERRVGRGRRWDRELSLIIDRLRAVLEHRPPVRRRPQRREAA